MVPFVFWSTLFFLIFQLIHGLVDRIMEVVGAPFVSVGDETGYYIKCSDVSELFWAYALFHSMLQMGNLELTLFLGLDFIHVM